MMKLLIATVFPLPGGGIWSFVSNLRENLIKQGHTVDVLCTRDDNKKVVLLNRNTVIDLAHYRPYVNEKLLQSVPHLVREPWVYNAEMNRYLFEQGVSELNLNHYDVIHAQDVIAAVALSRIKPNHLPLVTSVHGFLTGAIFHQYKTRHVTLGDREIWNSFLLQYYSRLEQIGYEASDYIHTSSQWMRGIIEREFRMQPSKIHTIRYGVKLSEFTQKLPSKRKEDKQIILVISRLVYLKGLHHLMEALSLLNNKNTWECRILGEGEMEKELKAECRRLGIEGNVKFLGNRSNVKEHLHQADMLVLPSLQENQPFAVIEAQLSGVPTIVSNAGGLPEMVDNYKNGVITEKANSRQLSESIQYLLENHEIRERMSQSAKQMGKAMWDVNRLGGSILELYVKARHDKLGIF
ncbi:glycosyltransferase family 4 protein [Rossellomorea sp. SC111]|uniref:glycosyltransferase family 4 protein n=1 Tax=Rossellomorea sp. SC111 TaxID=2968985 RepID=UPI00215A7058|nr:glycosyltransferase family 4 protein [Rossellomorea sp. SC111]MCR8848731.1 glycosyltransferase family 4 protein [Rossellomorea sp. SC111]